MARPRKNMLEAFRASANQGHTPRVPSQEVSAGGPFAPAKREPSAKRKVVERGARELAPGARDLLAIGRRFAPLVVGIALLIGAAFLAGRMSDDDDVQAAGDGGGSPANVLLSREPEAATGGEARPAPERPAPEQDRAAAAAAGSGDGGAEEAGERGEATVDDERFLDPANEYTIRVIEFRGNERGNDLAWDCYDYLRRQGLPAIRPVQQGDALILYVGASSDVGTLDSLKRYLTELPGPPPLSRPREFEGAYRVNIDDVVYR